MGEDAHLSCGSAGRRLPGQREGSRSRRRHLSTEQVDHVDLLVHPGTAAVLVESHRPVRHDLPLRIRVELRQRDQLLFGDTRQLADVLRRIGGQVLLELLEGDRPVGAGLVAHRLTLLEGVVGGQAVADIGRPRGKCAVFVYELLVHSPVFDHVARDEVLDCEIGLWLEDHLEVGDVAGAIAVGREVHDLHRLVLELAIRHARPQHRVALRHVGAPGDHRVGQFDVVVAAGRFVDPEGLDESRDG